MNTKTPQIGYAASVKDEHRAAVEAYIKKLTDTGLPVILSPAHFSLLVKIQMHELFSISNAPDRYYTDFSVRKHNGGKRLISAPLPLLLYLQKWVLSNILETTEIHPAAKAYRKRSSIKENAKFHRKQAFVFKSDVRDFFGSISSFWVYNYFRTLGYTKAVSRLLSGICTKNGCLPQGAATSGYLSNIFMKECDEKLLVYCREHGLRFTRYADDIAISGGEVDFPSLRQFVDKMLSDHDLNINLAKTRCIAQHARQKIAGVVVNSRMSPGRDFLRQLRQDIYYIEKYGIYGHARQTGWRSPQACLNNTLGRISHALFLLGKDKNLESKKRKLEQMAKPFDN
ncbi:reverse transcriptase family protein [uncultured Roseovarius sp.]|uniref:reverse transcriptase family protein n=1 Tax=uncultured Roseovarius sp. TaxID=293344 RepID=UPI00261B9E91|nr:reverse transcriptase family protein [uncultured Roseovarius sp.]